MMTKEELQKIKEHIEIHARREPGAVIITRILWKAVEELETLQEQLEVEKKLNEEIKVRFVKCNTCTDEMKSKCLMFSENLCEGDRCEELVDLMELINKSDLQKENARLKIQLEALSGDIPWNEIKDKSEVLGKLTEAKEIIRRLYRYIFLHEGFMEINDFNVWKNKVEAFLEE